jgi:hypothetical protein
MARVGNPEDDTISNLIKRYKSSTPKDILMFSLGEIDIRTHVKRRITFLKKTPEEFLDDVARKFIDKLMTLQKNVAAKVGVFSVTPTIYEALYMPKSEISGTDEERMSYTLILNQYLKTYAEESASVLYADVHQFFLDETGMLDPKKSDGVSGPNKALGFKVGCGIHVGAGESKKVVEYLTSLKLL